jgi:hypothetical protein
VQRKDLRGNRTALKGLGFLPSCAVILPQKIVIPSGAGGFACESTCGAEEPAISKFLAYRKLKC